MTLSKVHTPAGCMSWCSICRFIYAGKKSKVQTDPPTIPVADLLPGGIAAEGEWQSYKDKSGTFCKHCSLDVLTLSRCATAPHMSQLLLGVQPAMA